MPTGQRRTYLVDLRTCGSGSFSKTATWLGLPEVNGAGFQLA
jgi:hypothetical protein